MAGVEEEVGGILGLHFLGIVAALDLGFSLVDLDRAEDCLLCAGHLMAG